jgi:hypothetical protein
MNAEASPCHILTEVGPAAQAAIVDIVCLFTFFLITGRI